MAKHKTGRKARAHLKKLQKQAGSITALAEQLEADRGLVSMVSRFPSVRVSK